MGRDGGYRPDFPAANPAYTAEEKKNDFDNRVTFVFPMLQRNGDPATQGEQ